MYIEMMIKISAEYHVDFHNELFKTEPNRYDFLFLLHEIIYLEFCYSGLSASKNPQLFIIWKWRIGRVAVFATSALKIDA